MSRDTWPPSHFHRDLCNIEGTERTQPILDVYRSLSYSTQLEICAVLAALRRQLQENNRGRFIGFGAVSALELFVVLAGMGGGEWQKVVDVLKGLGLVEASSKGTYLVGGMVLGDLGFDLDMRRVVVRSPAPAVAGGG